MTHLVLGSAGQIGSHLVEYLKNQGEKVLTMDIVDGEWEDLRIQDNVILEEYLDECDFVYFLAFDVGGAKYLEHYQDTREFITNNMRIMSNTFHSIWQYNTPFIFASSQMAEMSHSSYGMLKALGEKITKNMNGLLVKFWNVYGKEHDEEKSHVITDFIKMAKEDGVIKMRTDGTESRQFLYVEDACEALFHFAKYYTKIPRDNEYHVTSFEWNTIKEIADFLDVITSCEVIPSDRKDETQKNAMNEPNPFVLDYWKPKTSLKDGIMKLYNLED